MAKQQQAWPWRRGRRGRRRAGSSLSPQEGAEGEEGGSQAGPVWAACLLYAAAALPPFLPSHPSPPAHHACLACTSLCTYKALNKNLLSYSFSVSLLKTQRKHLKRKGKTQKTLPNNQGERALFSKKSIFLKRQKKEKKK